MKREDLAKIIYAPCISEKSTRVQGEQQYVFKVHPDASKQMVAQAVQFLFAVEVAAVRTLNMGGKLRKFANIVGRHKAWKKAYVTLKPGQSIDVGVA